MRRQLTFAGTNHGQCRGVQQRSIEVNIGNTILFVVFNRQGQIGLSASHHQVDIGKNLGIKYSAMQFPMTVVDIITLT